MNEPAQAEVMPFLREFALQQGVKHAHVVVWHYFPGAGALRCSEILVPCLDCMKQTRASIFDWEGKDIPRSFQNQNIYMRRHRRREEYWKPDAAEDWYWFGQCPKCLRVAWTVLYDVYGAENVRPDVVVEVIA